MNRQQPLTPDERLARKALVDLARAMLAGDLPFMEGAVQALTLRPRIGGVSDVDVDFAAFVLISSETDHLPLASARHLWHPDTQSRLQAELASTQSWASTFAPEACVNLLKRYETE